MHILIPALHRPTKPTGVCRHAVNLAQCLASAHEVERVTLVIGKWQQEYFAQSFNLASDKVQTIAVDIPNSALSRNRWYVFGLPILATQLKPDLLHLSFPFPFMRSQFRVPIATTIHDLYPYEYPKNFGYPRVWFNQLFLQQCVQNSDGLACVSQCTLDALRYYFPQVDKRRQTAVIYNMVDFESITTNPPPQLESDRLKHPFLLTVAQHRKNKNLDVLIKAYGCLLRQQVLNPDCKLLLVGSSGPETPLLTELVASLGLDNRVIFLSGLEDSELRWLYENALLFVIPSSAEGFCLPLIEALVSSCPVVCSDIPIFREVGTSQCRYFELGQDICSNLILAISAELQCKRSLPRGLDSRFSSQEIKRQLLSFHKSLLRK